MFGNVIDTYDNIVVVKNNSNILPLYLKNVHVVFNENNRQIVGRIDQVSKETFKISFVGEIIANHFETGLYHYPNLVNSPHIVTNQELITFIGSQNLQDRGTLYIGKSPLYMNYNITANLNNFFSNHFAIIGNSGYGKSCGVARIVQNIFTSTKSIPKNAHILLFDVYNEYKNAFSKLSNIPGIHVKNYSNNLENNDTILKIPPYFLKADDLALLLNVEDAYLVPILEKAIQYVNIFKSEDPVSLEYKNNIIATCILEILSSGKSAPQIRDQILAILKKFHTSDINEESKIIEPGYTRTLRQCLNIDAQGKINALSLVVDFLSQFNKVKIEELAMLPNTVYSLEELYDALDFSLLAEGIYNNVTMYERAINLKIHLHQVMNGPYRHVFEYHETISLQEYTENIFKDQNGNTTQIVAINLDTIEDRFAKVLTKLYSKICFNYATSRINRATFPINIILEEAHRYVNNDHDTDIIGYNIFDRITKEGRKYGVVLGMITQRPSELSKTALSQCSNFLIFRIFHPEDYKMIESITSSINGEELERLKSLRKGMALTFGSAFYIPMLVQLDMPDPSPASSNVDIVETWY